MRITGNKGEWSELYALVKLLHTGKLYAADSNAKCLIDVYFPILRILRYYSKNENIDYVIHDDVIELYVSGNKISTIEKEQLEQSARILYEGIISGTERAFEINGAQNIMDLMLLDRISAASTDKTDITMQIHDVNTGYNPICGFSIKSELGRPPTLLNASGATNFVFEVVGINDEDMKAINQIDTKTKILDRMSYILQFGELKFVRVANAIFSANLMLIDSYMEDILASILLDYYQNKASDCRALIELIENKNPLGYPRMGYYKYKFKKFLCSIALGMMPAKEWNGHDETNGGYIVVKEDGDVLAYHLYNRDAFEEYLFSNTKFERGSTTRHGFASVYKENGKFYINLNLQIRFAK